MRLCQFAQSKIWHTDHTRCFLLHLLFLMSIVWRMLSDAFYDKVVLLRKKKKRAGAPAEDRAQQAKTEAGHMRRAKDALRKA